VGVDDRVSVNINSCGEVHKEPFGWWLAGFDLGWHGKRPGGPLASTTHLDGAAADAASNSTVERRPSQFDPTMDVNLSLESWHHFSAFNAARQAAWIWRSKKVDPTGGTQDDHQAAKLRVIVMVTNSPGW
jgi:hypothetical protein